MTATYEPIETKTLTSAAADIFFLSIPQTYTDLVLVQSTNAASAHLTVAFRVNSDNASNYSWNDLWGNGTSVGANRRTTETYGRLSNYGGPDTTGRTLDIAHFMNYSNTTTNKIVISKTTNNGGSFPGVQFNTNLWRSTSAITSINLLTVSGGQFAIGSTFTLYGIKAE
jgi:hypothetical protein